MKIDQKVIDRLQHLIEQITEIKAKSTNYEYGTHYDREKTFIFGTNSLNLLERVFGTESVHYKKFNQEFNLFSQVQINLHKHINGMSGILVAAKDDYENGYLFNIRSLIEAEVFVDFLEQSEYLLIQGYFTAAAVIAGSVLEDGLRKLCVKNGVTLSAKPKLDTMNADLAKAGVYNLLKQKQIMALADLRNKAAHGQGGFTKEDVESMIKDVRRFMEDYFS
ncbi:MAG TPA: hypothetical protein VF692_05730 [Pyrinomonadaceae bacterium]|jgi:hypothetical protein